METSLFNQLNISDQSASVVNLKLYCQKNDSKDSIRFLCFKCFNMLGFTFTTMCRNDLNKFKLFIEKFSGSYGEMIHRIYDYRNMYFCSACNSFMGMIY